MYSAALIDGRYRLVDRIGTGAMGQVWRARDERLQREVAVKVVDLSQATGAVTRDRFQREVHATARLNHPNIVTIFDGGFDGDIAFLVMELLAGESLAERLRRGPLPLAEARRVGAEVARALQATHAIGVVHRDVKPGNVMVSGNSVKVLDFGIAQLATEATADFSAPAAVMGTAAYMSPEQALGRRAGPPSDVYSLGCLMVALLAGRAPFVGSTSIEVAQQQINGAPPRLSQLRPDVPRDLDELVARMLAKDPAARPDAAAVVAALRGAGTPADATAVLPSLGPPPTGPALVPATQVLPTGVPGVPPATQVLPTGVPVVPTSPASSRPEDAWFKRGVTWVLLGMLGVVVIGAVWLGGQYLIGQWTAQASSVPTASATPSKQPTTTKPTTAKPTTAKPTTAKPTPTLPSISLPSIGLPNPSQAALQAAVGSVATVLDAWAPSDRTGQAAKQALTTSWTDASANILDGRDAAANLASFNDQVKQYHRSGDIPAATYGGLTLATRGVKALL